MDRRLDWIVWKGLFAAALYFAVIEQVGWVQYALSAFVWSMLVVSLWAAPQGSALGRCWVHAGLSLRMLCGSHWGRYDSRSVN